jgi:hydroxymethylpyrimidine/phosphomethylpyrimidine kinase
VQNQTSPLVLTFGGSDPVGATGIQADLASFAAMGCHGVSVVTSILISDTTGIEDIQPIDAEWVSDQARVLLEDMPVAAFKVGIIGSMDSVGVIAEVISDYADAPLVLDPFSSGMPDQGEEGEEILLVIRELLIPQATLMLLSAVELGQLAETWREPTTEDTLNADALRLIDMGCRYLLVTGAPGNGPHEVVNLLFDESGVVRRDSWPRLPGSFSGAGSTLSGTIAAMLANKIDVPEAVFEAQEFTNAALAGAHRFGMGKLTPDRYFWARESDAGDPDVA